MTVVTASRGGAEGRFPSALATGTTGTGHAATDRATRVGACLVRAANGETAALDEIVRELNPLLWHVARGEGLGAEEAADVVQTTWLELLRRLHDIRSPRALTSWLVTTTRRALDYRRLTRTLDVSAVEAPDELHVRVTTHEGTTDPARELAGLTLYVPERMRVRLNVDGHDVPSLKHNSPDGTGRPSVSIPWAPLEFPRL